MNKIKIILVCLLFTISLSSCFEYKSNSEIIVEIDKKYPGYQIYSLPDNSCDYILIDSLGGVNVAHWNSTNKSISVFKIKK